MRSKANLASTLVDYWAARAAAGHWHPEGLPLPISYTLGLTYRCNSRCKTCRVYDRPDMPMTPTEWKAVFNNINSEKMTPYWVTFTGGEPFLYDNIAEVYWNLVDTLKPAIVNIPTNGILTEKIADAVWDMARMDQKTKLIINVSIDHIDPERDAGIRGVKGHLRAAMDTINKLKASRSSNLTIGVHTVISKHNWKDMRDIARNLALFADPGHYITEMAEPRFELGTIDMKQEITPSAEEYRHAIHELLAATGGHKGLIGAMRKEYYRRAIGFLDGTNKGAVKCYAGYASCQITPNGDVWLCCMQGENSNIGNLRNDGYDFVGIWNSRKAAEARMALRKCRCQMANAGYTNTLMSPVAMSRVFGNLVTGRIDEWLMRQGQ